MQDKLLSKIVKEVFIDELKAIVDGGFDNVDISIFNDGVNRDILLSRDGDLLNLTLSEKDKIVITIFEKINGEIKYSTEIQSDKSLSMLTFLKAGIALSC